jgi:hypothetical protein
MKRSAVSSSETRRNVNKFILKISKWVRGKKGFFSEGRQYNSLLLILFFPLFFLVLFSPVFAHFSNSKKTRGILIQTGDLN